MVVVYLTVDVKLINTEDTFRTDNTKILFVAYTMVVICCVRFCCARQLLVLCPV